MIAWTFGRGSGPGGRSAIFPSRSIRNTGSVDADAVAIGRDTADVLLADTAVSIDGIDERRLIGEEHAADGLLIRPGPVDREEDDPCGSNRSLSLFSTGKAEAIRGTPEVEEDDPTPEIGEPAGFAIGPLVDLPLGGGLPRRQRPRPFRRARSGPVAAPGPGPCLKRDLDLPGGVDRRIGIAAPEVAVARHPAGRVRRVIPGA